MMKRKFKVVLTNLAFPDRDLSPALISLKNYALEDEFIREKVSFDIKQFIYTENINNIVRDLYKLKADLYGFSLYVWNYNATLKIAEILKSKLPETKIVFGGPEASGLSKLILEKYSFVDMVVLGEGEAPFKNILMYFLGKLVEFDFPGIAFRSPYGGYVFSREGTYIEELNELSSIYKDKHYLNYLNKVKTPITATYETSRGCPFHCRYCSWGDRRKVRYYEIDRIKEELNFLLNAKGVGRIYITDSDIFLNKNRGKEILRYLLKNNHNNLPIIFEVNPELLDTDAIKLIAQFENDEFAFGLQSSSPSVLNAINRRFDPYKYSENIKKLKKINPDIKIWFSLIIGLPGDSLRTFKESLAFAISMKPYSLYIHEFLCLPGSEFFKNQDQFGIQCEEEAPHKLLAHKKFSKEDYNVAKELGFWAALFHYYNEIREAFFDYAQKHKFTNVQLLELYKEFGDYMQSKEHLFDNESPAEIPSFEFDMVYNRIIKNKQLSKKIKRYCIDFLTLNPFLPANTGV